jgi:cell division protease FtsH
MAPGAPSPKQSFPFVVLVIPAMALALIATFLVIWQFLTPTERRIPVAYSDFLAEVHAGRVEEIHIHDREIRYRLRSPDARRSTVRETVGPIPDQALIETLKPTDPNAPLPKITFEK